MTRGIMLLVSLLLLAGSVSVTQALSSWTSSDAVHAVEHLLSPPLQAATPLEDIANTRIPGPPGSGVEILAHVATPVSRKQDDKLPVLILIHEFFGLNPSIVEKAKSLADDLGCVVVAPDTFRGEVTDFIPKAIWLALSTPTDRVNDDLDAICNFLKETTDESSLSCDTSKLAVMGFCYGGGKAIQYTTKRRNDAATVIFYGKPVTEVPELEQLQAPVCGVYGRDDVQFSMNLIDQFKTSLSDANVESNIQVYDGVGHAFWSDMDQIRTGKQPQTDAYNQCTEFLRDFFDGK